MAQDLMLSKMVEYRLLNPDAKDVDNIRFFKNNNWWHKNGRKRSVCWYNAYRLVEAFRCLYIREDWYPITKADIQDYVKRVREWEIREVPFKKMLRKTYELRYVQEGLEEL